MPALATFTNVELASPPAHVRYVATPRSIARTEPASATSTAPSTSWGMSNVRTKSQPVPRGITASSAAAPGARPFTTSFTEPSPPTTTRSVAPPATASAASSESRPGASEMSASPSSPFAAARCAISGQRLPVVPPAEAGLTRKTVRPALMAVAAGGRRVERDLRHAVDRGPEVFIGDAHELALDDDVAHRQQTPAVDAAKRRQGEERCSLHLDGQDASLGPALVLTPIRVVEQVAGDDRPDAVQLAGVLRDVHGLVHEQPARGRAVRLAADEMRRRRVGGHGRDRDDQVTECVVGLETAAGPDAQQPLHAELDQLLEDDGRARAAHAGSLDGDRLAVPDARVAEQPALRVHLSRVLEVRLGDVLRAQRVAGEEARLRIVAGLRSEMDRHRQDPTSSRPSGRTELHTR